jgi:hypothetical protein
MQLGTIYISTEFRPDRTSKYGHQVAILEKNKVL